ncbi:hypothetical protein HDV06_005890 [Boothiomyces sp. JEL0866]|nr:hypothetical protein HDV06_005890 [Boothiomyces sp. JEL0866]
MFAFKGISTPLYDSIIQEEYSLTTCGQNPFPMDEGCCFSNLDQNMYDGYGSISQKAAFADRPNFPLAANGAAYCHLQSNDNTSLFGYSDIWFRADESCINSHFTCMKTGQIQYYTESGCRGDFKAAQLFTAPSSHQFPDIGNFSGDYTIISSGSEVFTWTAFLPGEYLVFKYQETMEIVAIMAYAFGIIISLMVLGIYIHKFTITSSFYLTIVVLSQILWLLWIVMQVIYYNVKFPNNGSHVIETYRAFQAGIFNIASLATVMNTLLFLVSFRSVSSTRFKEFVYLIIGSIHLLFAGGNYTLYWSLIQKRGSVWDQWHSLTPIWTLFMVFFNTIPAFTITIPLVKSSQFPRTRNISTSHAVLRLVRTDWIFLGLVLLQGFTSFCMATTFYIQQRTQLPGSDRNFISLDGVLSLLYAIHTVINCMFLEHIRSILNVRISQRFVSRDSLTAVWTLSLTRRKARKGQVDHRPNSNSEEGSSKSVTADVPI